MEELELDFKQNETAFHDREYIDDFIGFIEEDDNLKQLLADEKLPDFIIDATDLLDEYDYPYYIIIYFLYSIGYSLEQIFQAMVLNTDELFRSSPSLKYIKIPDNSNVGSFMFDSSGLKRVTLPKNLVEIESYAFRNTYIEEIDVPESVEYLNDGCFMYCDSLKKIILRNDEISWPGAASTPIFPNEMPLTIYTNSEAIKKYVKEHGYDNITILPFN